MREEYIGQSISVSDLAADVAFSVGEPVICAKEISNQGLRGISVCDPRYAVSYGEASLLPRV